MHKKFKDNLQNHRYIFKSIIHMKIVTKQQKLNLKSIYSLEDCKVRDGQQLFYEQLQTIIDEIPNEELLNLMKRQKRTSKGMEEILNRHI